MRDEDGDFEIVNGKRVLRDGRRYSARIVAMDDVPDPARRALSDHQAMIDAAARAQDRAVRQALDELRDRNAEVAAFERQRRARTQESYDRYCDDIERAYLGQTPEHKRRPRRAMPCPSLRGTTRRTRIGGMRLGCKTLGEVRDDQPRGANCCRVRGRCKLSRCWRSHCRGPDCCRLVRRGGRDGANTRSRSYTCYVRRGCCPSRIGGRLVPT